MPVEAYEMNDTVS